MDYMLCRVCDKEDVSVNRSVYRVCDECRNRIHKQLKQFFGSMTQEEWDYIEDKFEFDLNNTKFED